MKCNKVKILFFLLLIVSCCGAQVSEQEYKAAFIERFTRFVEWPDKEHSNFFNIMVIGETPMQSSLNKLFEKQQIKNKAVKLIYADGLIEPFDIDLLFIASTEKRKVREILSLTQKLPILTISDSKGFAQLGVHINMYRNNNYIRYEINEESFKHSNLEISSLLLSTAKIVNSND
jgi:hypothetical protein